MCMDKDPPPCEHDDLIAQVDRLQDRNARLTTTIKELRKQLAAAQRAGKRQAAPFSKGGPDRQAQTSWSKAWHGELQLP